jgi:hypothetical protein
MLMFWYEDNAEGTLCNSEPLRGSLATADYKLEMRDFLIGYLDIKCHLELLIKNGALTLLTSVKIILRQIS